MYQNNKDRGYTGHRSNDIGGNDLGLVYMGARYYSPSANRMISADIIVPNPTDPQSLNRYSYVLNNPVNLIDPMGYCAENWEDDIECWEQYFILFESLRDKYEDPSELIGSGLDWILTDLDTALRNGRGEPVILEAYLIIRRAYEEIYGDYGNFQGSYLTYGMYEDGVFGAGRLINTLTFKDSPAVCGVAVAVANIGGGIACTGLGYVDSALNCIQLGPGADCIVDWASDEIGGRIVERTFSKRLESIGEGIARSSGRRLAASLSIAVDETLQLSSRLGDYVSDSVRNIVDLVVGGPVYAPDCSMLNC